MHPKRRKASYGPFRRRADLLPAGNDDRRFLPPMLIAAVLLACTLQVIDGDTLRCGRERIRLIGIDAPELPGHCRRGRRCVAGDPFASRERLRRAVARAPAKIERLGSDRYGRTLALVSVANTDLGCHQLRGHAATYKPGWDTDQRLARRCPWIAD